MLHKDMIAADIHIIVSWVAANAAARVALVTVAADIHKVCYQTDTAKYYALIGSGPSVWTAINAASVDTDGLPEGIANLYFTAARVRATVLTGLSLAANVVIAATDTVLVALGSLQKQITDLVNNRIDVIPIACSDETTALTTGVKVTLIQAYLTTFNLTSIKASLTTAQATGALFTIDVKVNGVSAFTTKPTFNNTAKTTVGAATPSVLTATPLAIAANAEITVEVFGIGDGTAKGLKIYLLGNL